MGLLLAVLRGEEAEMRYSAILMFLALFACFDFVEPAPKGNCFIVDFAYGGDNILVSGKHNVKGSADQCQQSCQVITNCQFFSFYETNGYCELKYGGNGLPLPGVISGPKIC